MAIDADQCPECGYTMGRGFMGALYCGNCRKYPQPTKPQTPTGEIRNLVDNIANPENIPGPPDAPVWTVTCSAKRPGMRPGETYTEVLHVHADTAPGALSIAQEFVLDWIDGEAYQVSE